MAAVVPKDTFVMSFGLFYLLGIMVLVPYFFFINAFDFWMYRFQESDEFDPDSNVTLSKYQLENGYFEKPSNVSAILENHDLCEQKEPPTRPPFRLYYFQKRNDNLNLGQENEDNEDYNIRPERRNGLQANVTSALSLNFQSLMLVSLVFILTYCKKLPSPEKRLTWCICTITFIFPISIILTQIQTMCIAPAFFTIAMVFTTLLNGLAGTAMASLYELLTKFPPNCLVYLQCGTCFCGIASGILRIVLLPTLLRPDQITAIYFAFGSIIMISITIYYFYVIKTSKFFIYSISQKEANEKNKRLFQKVKLGKMLNKGKWFYASIFFCYGTTNSVNPGLMVLVVPKVEDSVWKEIYFVPVVTMLGFYGFLFLGRVLAMIIKTPKHGIVLFILSVLRIGFVPLLIFCNAQPRKIPAYFEDHDYIVFMALFGLSEGILVIKSLVAMLPLFEGDEKEAAMVFISLVTVSAIMADMTVPSQPILYMGQMSSIISIVCRICYDSEKDEELITPCNCKGTVAFVHRSCLETWLGESNTTTCELCHQIFHTERVPRYTSAKSVWHWCWRSNGSSQDVRSDVVACTIITPLIIIITYVCLFSSEYYNQVKFSSIPAARWTSVSLLIMIGIMLIGYYMWVYSTIRMHARRWYNWWQRTCNVRYIPPGTARVLNVNFSAENTDGGIDESNGTVTSFPIADVATSITDARNVNTTTEVNSTSILNGISETVV